MEHEARRKRYETKLRKKYKKIYPTESKVKITDSCPEMELRGLTGQVKGICIQTFDSSTGIGDIIDIEVYFNKLKKSFFIHYNFVLSEEDQARIKEINKIKELK